jgi:hypothetical protein
VELDDEETIMFGSKRKLGFAIAALAICATESQAQNRHRVRIVDVSMAAVSTWVSNRGDFSQFAANENGDTFWVKGSIYPGGTIPAGDEVFGPEEGGRVGTWLCRGVFNFDFDPEILAGEVPHVWTTQLFLLQSDGLDPDADLTTGDGLVTEGLEGGMPTERVIVGGTGRCAGARGSVTQEQLGFSSGGLFNHRFTFRFDHLPAGCRLP